MVVVNGLNGTIKDAIEELQSLVPVGGGSSNTYATGQPLVILMGGLDVQVIWPVYYLDGVAYAAGSATITLAAADVTDNRFDAIILDSSGLNKITGTPSATPAQPTVEPTTQLLVTYILVEANQTDLTVDDILVYDEGTETTVTSNGTIDDQSTAVTPVSGTYVLSMGSFNNTHYIDFTFGADQSVAQVTQIKYFIRLISAFSNTTYLRFTFYRAGATVSNTVNVVSGLYNFLRTTTGAFQVNIIPIGAFNFTDGLFDKIRITFNGSNASGFYLDFASLQVGVAAANPIYNFFKTILDEDGLPVIATQPNDTLQLIGATKTGAKELTVGGGGGGGTWGSITGTLSSQTDLQSALDAKVAGPGSATNGAVVLYDGTTGKLIKNSTILPTTVGIAIANLTNPSAITFIRINADNTVTARSAANFLSDISGQPLDATLTALAGLATGANKIPYSTGTDTFGQLDFKDEDDMASDSATGIPSQKSVKAYVDTKPLAYWTTLPGTPTRSSNTVLTITDTSNANLYDLKFNRGTVLKWTDTTVKQAMVVSATYSSNTVTITIMGDVLASSATMNTFKYALEKAEKVTFAIAGTLATGTDLARKWKADKPYRVFGADGLHGTAGTTNATTYDINKNGTTFMTTKLSIASAATVGNGYTANDGTTLALDDVVTLDCDSVSTTAPIDVYVDLFIFPTYNQYL